MWRIQSIGPKDTAFSQSDQHPSNILFWLAGQVSRPVAVKANLTFGWICRVEPWPEFGVYSSVHVKSCVALNCTPRWRSWTYGHILSKLFLCWTRGGTDCRHSLWVSWGSSTNMRGRGWKQQEDKVYVFSYKSRKVSQPDRKITNCIIEKVVNFNYLGLLISTSDKLNCHIDHVSKKVSQVGGVINDMKKTFPSSISMTI